MFAIRSRNGKRPFRRSGVEFAAEAWTFQDEITDAQKGEPMLLILDVEDENDPRLLDVAPLLKEEDAAPKGEETADTLRDTVLQGAQGRIDDLQQSKDLLAGEVVTLKAEADSRGRERAALQSENAGLKASLAEFALANEDLGQERETMLAERATLLAEIETLKAAQAASASPANDNGPAGPPADTNAPVAPAPEPSGKDANGKSAKNAASN